MTQNVEYGEIISTEEEQPVKKFQKGQLPRRWRDRSKYGPHQGERERERRKCQILRGKLEVPIDVFQAVVDHAEAELRKLGIPKPAQIVIQAPCASANATVSEAG